ncbi:hypothetical protein T492DRAFT_884238, partial [Pavlovales sp. CCMP2436]
MHTLRRAASFGRRPSARRPEEPPTLTPEEPVTAGELASAAVEVISDVAKGIGAGIGALHRSLSFGRQRKKKPADEGPTPEQADASGLRVRIVDVFLEPPRADGGLPREVFLIATHFRERGFITSRAHAEFIELTTELHSACESAAWTRTEAQRAELQFFLSSLVHTCAFHMRADQLDSHIERRRVAAGFGAPATELTTFKTSGARALEEGPPPAVAAAIKKGSAAGAGAQAAAADTGTVGNGVDTGVDTGTADTEPEPLGRALAALSRALTLKLEAVEAGAGSMAAGEGLAVELAVEQREGA